jgi:hypothetical protein
LGITGFLSVLVTAVLGFSFTGTRVSMATSADRDATYAATSALEASIQQARRLPWVGRIGAPCPTTTLTVRKVTAIVSCTSTTTLTQVDRTLQLTATVNGNVRASAKVVVRDSTAGGGDPSVDVVSWSAA